MRMTVMNSNNKCQEVRKKTCVLESLLGSCHLKTSVIQGSVHANGETLYLLTKMNAMFFINLNTR